MALKDLFKRKHYYIAYANEERYFSSYYRNVNASTWTHTLCHAKKFRSKSKAIRTLNKIQLTTQKTLKLLLV